MSSRASEQIRSGDAAVVIRFAGWTNRGEASGKIDDAASEDDTTIRIGLEEFQFARGKKRFAI